MILSLGATFCQSLGPNGATSTPFKAILMVFEGLFRPDLGPGQPVFIALKGVFLVLQGRFSCVLRSFFLRSFAVFQCFKLVFSCV